MKTRSLNLSKLAPIILLAVVMLMASGAAAQRFRNMQPRPEVSDQVTAERPAGFCRNLPGITPEQTQQMDALRIKNMKETQQLRNELGEKQARLRTLSTSDKPDQNAINKTIDEISAIKANMQKNRMATHQEIRKLLNDEQRVIFDNNNGPGKRGRGPRDNQGSYSRGKGFRAECPYRN